MDRANNYAVFSFAVLGFYVGVLFANSGPISTVLIVGAGLMTGLFAATFVLFVRIHRAANLLVLPTPRDLDAQTDARNVPEAIISAFEDNAPAVRADQALNSCLLSLVGLQVASFLAVTLFELLG